MEMSELESKFVETFTNRFENEFDFRRTKNDMLYAFAASPCADFGDLTVSVVFKILSDKLVLMQTFSATGELICSGSRPVDTKRDDNPDFDEILEKQYGGKPLKKEWVWSGEYKK